MICIFCGKKPKDHDGPHHIISKSARKSLGLTGARANKLPTNYKVPICGQCHETLTLLQKPLLMIINHLTGRGPLPPTLGPTVEDIYQRLQSPGENRQSTPKAKKDGYESVQELFEDNYHEGPTYETSVSDRTEVEK